MAARSSRTSPTSSSSPIFQMSSRRGSRGAARSPRCRTSSSPSAALPTAVSPEGEAPQLHLLHDELCEFKCPHPSSHLHRLPRAARRVRSRTPNANRAGAAQGRHPSGLGRAGKLARWRLLHPHVRVRLLLDHRGHLVRFRRPQPDFTAPENAFARPKHRRRLASLSCLVPTAGALAAPCSRHRYQFIFANETVGSSLVQVVASGCI